MDNPKYDELIEVIKDIGNPKINAKDDEKFKWVRCSWCGKYFRELSWNDPPSCPFCHRSRVD